MGGGLRKQTGAVVGLMGFVLERLGCSAGPGFFAYVFKALLRYPSPPCTLSGERDGGDMARVRMNGRGVLCLCWIAEKMENGI